MAIDSPPDVILADGNLSVSRYCILTDVHDSIFLTPTKQNEGTFIGVKSDQSGSSVVFPVGKLKYETLLTLF